MKFRLLLALLAVVCTVPRLSAQSDDEDDDNYIDLGFYADAKSSIRVGFRVMDGAKVGFHNVGSIVSEAPAALSEGAAHRGYTDGYVLKDAPRTSSSDLPTEVDANGNQTSTPGGRYQITAPKVDSNGNPVLDDAGNPRTTVSFDGLSYTSGQSRYWNIQHAGQVSEDGTSVTLHQYTATSEGASFAGKKSASPGVELQMARDVKKFGHFSLSLTGGVSINTISGKRSASVTSTLHTLSDTYQLKGTITNPSVSVPYTGPNTGALYDSDDGSLISLTGYETTIPISDTPGSRTETDTAGAAQIDGFWKVKGAYYALRVGPELRLNLPKGLSLAVAAGVTGTFAGTTFSAQQQMKIKVRADDPATADVDETEEDTVSTSHESSVTKVFAGYYVDVQAAWAINERSGFYAGATYEQLGNYSQTLDGQTAKIDLNGQTGVHGGLSIKF
jgi:hypothetical protein